MQKLTRRERIALENEKIITLNSMGLSLKTIGRELDKHPTTISERLDTLGIEPADTRRSFMEDIYFSLSDKHREWLESQVGPNSSVKDVMKSLIALGFMNRKTQTSEA